MYHLNLVITLLKRGRVISNLTCYEAWGCGSDHLSPQIKWHQPSGFASKPGALEASVALLGPPYLHALLPGI